MQDVALLKAEKISKSFKRSNRDIVVLKEVSLTLDAGETLIITGKSGAGKSTLLSLLSGLDIPDSGSVYICGIETKSVSQNVLAQLRRENVGIVFQNFNLLPSWTALENVEAGLMHTDIDAAARRDRALKWLEKLGIGDCFDQLPSELSVGQQQRVAIARTLVHDPKLIFADEPTGDVDPETGTDIVNHLRAAVNDRNAALFVVTHGTYPISQQDRVLRLANGVLEPAQ